MINNEYIQAIWDGDNERLAELRKSPKTKLCHHYRRVNVDAATGASNHLPQEEFRIWEVFYESPPWHEVEMYFAVKESLLKQNSDATCICSQCTREFQIENMDKMMRLFDRMNEMGNLWGEQDIRFSDLQILKLYQKLEPTWYQEDYKKNIVVLETENDPRKWAATDECLKWNIVADYAREYPVLKLPELGERGGRNRYVCKHYRRQPSGIVTCKINMEGAELVLPRFGGGVESLLFTNPYGVCKCRECRQVFSPQEQEQMERLVSYLNTPHYYDEDALAHHDEWKAVLEFYDENYQEENDPYTLLSTDKILELTQGVEPVLYRETHKKNKAEVLKKLCWTGQEWEC